MPFTKEPETQRHEHSFLTGFQFEQVSGEDSKDTERLVELHPVYLMARLGGHTTGIIP